jgi:membrane fusion protein (multidrug efflux system)
MAHALLICLTIMATLAIPSTNLKLVQDAPASEPAVEKPKTSRAKILLPVLVALAVIGGGTTYALSAGTETTDDAQVEGHVANVSPRIGGQVKKVLITDNQEVKAGDVLVELDDRDFVAKLASAKADLAAATASLHTAESQLTVTSKSATSNLVVAKGGVTQAAAGDSSTRANIAQARADIDAAKARRDLAKIELDRSNSLRATDAIAQADVDAKKATFDQADASLTQAQARLDAAHAGLATSAGTIESARGRLLSAELGPDQVSAAEAQVELAKAKVDQAKAALVQAELNESYTQIKAETSGIIARRSVEIGQTVSPDRPLFAIVPLEDTWVVANFKEDQLEHMKKQQAVTISIDAYPGMKLHGHVDSLSAGTGSRFALLPPDNASGNFTKVVQRVPVLVRLDGDRTVDLRPGMSAKVSVATK